MTLRELHYYAIREIGGFLLRREALIHPVTYIACSIHHYGTNWVYNRKEGMHLYLTDIEQWEFDMLTAFDIPVANMADVMDGTTP